MSANVDLLGTIGPIIPTPAAERSPREAADASEIADARYESTELGHHFVAPRLEPLDSRFSGQELLVHSQGSLCIGAGPHVRSLPSDVFSNIRGCADSTMSGPADGAKSTICWADRNDRGL
jgi:hypothetical protein